MKSLNTGSSMDKWRIKSRKNVFSRKIFTIDDLECYHDKKNENHTFTIIRTPVWINVVAVTSDKRIILVKQHRLGTDEITYETPAGIAESNEDPIESAKRELLEETGCIPKKIVLMKKLKANPAIMDTDIYFYFAEGCEFHNEQSLDEAEDIEVELFSIEEIVKMIDDGRIDHSIIITAILLYLKDFHK